MSFERYICPVLWRGDIEKQSATRPAQNQSPNGNTPQQEKRAPGFIIINYLSKFSPSTATVCEPLEKLTSNKAVWTWNTSYQDIYDKTKSLIKANACMKFYDDTKPLYLETEIGIGLDAALLQTRDGTSCPKESAPDNTIL